MAEDDEDREALDSAQSALHVNPMDVILQQKEKEQYHKFIKSSYLADVYLKQRSKVTWIQLGDDNSTYFFFVIRHKKLQQAIMQVKDSTEVLQTEYDHIAKVFVAVYQELLGKEFLEI